MHPLTQLIYHDMKPALGVTEPGAIAFAVAKAKAQIGGTVELVELRLNSGMYKNAFTCGIPGSTQVGNLYAAALGATGADAQKGLERLDGITDAQHKQAQQLVDQGKVRAEMSEVTSRIYIEAGVTTDQGHATVIIRDSHTNITEIRVNGDTVFLAQAEEIQDDGDLAAPIHSYTLAQLVDYAQTVDLEEIAFVEEAYTTNLALFEEGLGSSQTTFAPFLLAQNGGKRFSDDEEKTASLLCNAAIEARVIGLTEPAMSITGSGAHGIIATLPLYAAYQVQGYSKEQLLRATRPQLSGLYVHQGVFRKAVGLLRLRHCRRHRHGLRAGAGCAAAHWRLWSAPC